ncbi:hypothetical protein BOX37_27735 [Nocardia mangyaensis]|uniref:AMP-dependent synthetase/ligase domain-containing protein n=1 Tax=Nocardia mangyaensis TaxID=2213200 RepID=A0A1J0VYL5_9NOCA|nr:AMP-binding protein [Nocardia mangyaensis]APE37089.1 hypothetical protein BOX37_27735 [Nocardia mangyaensis]
MTNLAWNLKKSAEQYPEHAALRLDEQMLTYSEFDEMSSRVAGWLHEHGHSPGDRVGIMLPNVIAFPVIYYGILRAGLIAVPMNPLLKEREVRHYIDDSGAELIFAWHTASEEVAAAVATDDVHVVTVGKPTSAATPGLRDSLEAIGQIHWSVSELGADATANRCAKEGLV